MRMSIGFIAVALLACPRSGAASSCVRYTDLYFAPGAATLTVLQEGEILDAIEHLEKRSRILQVIATGHADASDALAAVAAVELAARRANAVQAFVVKVRPALKQLTYAESKGMLQPQAPAGDSKNRRVELQLICPSSGAPPPLAAPAR